MAGSRTDIEFIQLENQGGPSTTSKAARQHHNSKKKLKGGNPSNPGNFHGAHRDYWEQLPWWVPMSEDPATSTRAEPTEEEMTGELTLEKKGIIEKTEKQITGNLRYMRQIHFERTPWSDFLDQLGERAQPPSLPRQLASWQLYMIKKHNEIDKVFAEQWPDAGLDDKHPFRCQIARDMLQEETSGYRAALDVEAEELHTGDTAAAEAEALEAAKPASEDVQESCHDNIAGIVQPLLEGLRQQMGFHLTLFAGVPLKGPGGPEFKLKVITAGKTTGPTPVPWHLFERDTFRTDIMASFTQYLMRTDEYTVRKAALSGETPDPAPGPSSVPTPLPASTAAGTSRTPSGESHRAAPSSKSKGHKLTKHQKGKRPARGDSSSKNRRTRDFDNYVSSGSDKDLSDSSSSSGSESDRDGGGSREDDGHALGEKENGNKVDDSVPDDVEVPSLESLRMCGGPRRLCQELSQNGARASPTIRPCAHVRNHRSRRVVAVFSPTSSYRPRAVIILFGSGSGFSYRPRIIVVLISSTSSYCPHAIVIPSGRAPSYRLLIPVVVFYAGYSYQSSPIAILYYYACCSLSCTLQIDVLLSGPFRSHLIVAPSGPPPTFNATITGPGLSSSPTSRTSSLSSSGHVSLSSPSSLDHPLSTPSLASSSTSIAAEPRPRRVHKSAPQSLSHSAASPGITALSSIPGDTAPPAISTLPSPAGTVPSAPPALPSPPTPGTINLDILGLGNIINDNRWPDWIRDPFDWMEARQLGREFMHAAECWTVLERTYNWATSSHGRGTAHRPPEVFIWVHVATDITQASWVNAVKDVACVLASMVSPATMESSSTSSKRPPREPEEDAPRHKSKHARRA
ncbi:hypothetical protein C8Q80DRAFT_1274755 [Daedaleopsis nitida]|nr:hypothetical protein C8Q80DRAFT_1274755 [Daedaleopsis nitida]